MLTLCKRKEKAQVRIQKNAAWKTSQAALASNFAQQADNASAGKRRLALGQFSLGPKTHALARRREVDPVQDQRQLRTRDFNGLAFFERRLVGQLIGSLLQLLIPDAEPGLPPVEDLDPIPAAETNTKIICDRQIACNVKWR